MSATDKPKSIIINCSMNYVIIISKLWNFRIRNSYTLRLHLPNLSGWCVETFINSLYHYQDYDNKEIDAVVELKNGDWCAFEIKLGANQIDFAAESLLKINKKIKEDPKGKPAKILCVICGLSNAAYKRPDGVYVVPITALKN